MANLMRRNTGRSADPWRDFFDMSPWGGSLMQRGSSLPAVNISEDKDNYLVDVVAPGFRKEDFRLKVDDDILTISAESKHEEQEGGNGREYSRREYSYSSFTRSFRLPDNAQDDNIRAGYRDGVLEITIPKAGDQVKASKEINID